MIRSFHLRKSLFFFSLFSLFLMGISSVVAETYSYQKSEFSRPVEAVSYVDLDRYLGSWYQISYFPAFFQRRCAATKAQYLPAPGNKIRVVNFCFTKSGKRILRREGQARVVDTKSQAKLKVGFRPVIKLSEGDYWIIGLDENYQWAIVGTPDRKYLWILSRTPKMDSDLYRELVEKAREQGFNVGRLEKTPTWPL